MAPVSEASYLVQDGGIVSFAVYAGAPWCGRGRAVVRIAMRHTRIEKCMVFVPGG
uniref:Uncharacterized protein n=1 Tax=Oryza brachyantha TaxID=4533 RepID=J3L2C2_ORYBR